MFICYHIEASIQDAAHICEEIRSEFGLVPFSLSFNDVSGLVNYNEKDMALLLDGKMTRTQYIERNKVKFLE